MRFMVITKATAASEAGVPPTTEDFETVGAFVQELVDAGVLLAADGLHPSSAGARLYFDENTTTVVDGPFTETKELVAGYFLVETASLAECVEWFRRYPVPGRGTGERPHVEIRRVFQAEDFGDEFTAEQRAAVAAREATVVAAD